jgi:phosphoglycerol transferase MdoB-like AlkP superfamily enzyme
MLKPIEKPSVVMSPPPPDTPLSDPACGSPPPASPRALRGLMATARQFVTFCSQHRVWLACMVVFVAVWTVELYTVQSVTLVYPNDTSSAPRFVFWAPKIRLTLDLLFISVLTFWLRRRWLVVVLAGSFFAYLGLITYFHYFLRPLTLTTIFGNWREGLRMTGSTWELFPKREALVLLLALGVELGALFLSRRASLPRRCAWLAGALATVAYLSLYLVANFLDPLDWIQTTRGVGRLGEIRGYLGPWFAEWYYLRDQQILDRAVALRAVHYDRLTPLEADIPIHPRLVIVQAESFDYNILDHQVDGKLVTPFLHHLREISMFYRVRAMHTNGSADADFAALNGVRGSDHENTYVIAGYPYSNTTPQVLARCGFATYSFHGNSGEFYGRRAAFQQMGLAGIYFQEELQKDFGMAADSWGVRDKDVLTLSAQQLRTAKSPTCHFIITLTTHTPYTYLPNEREIFPHPRTTAQHYINNMRYLDNCLRDYITSLGSGATVMIYADHPTEEGDGDFTPDRSLTGQFIPCFIYDTDPGQDLSKLQKTRNDLAATDGTWNLVDVINYLRGQVARSFPPAQHEPAEARVDVPAEK